MNLTKTPRRHRDTEVFREVFSVPLCLWGPAGTLATDCQGIPDPDPYNHSVLRPFRSIHPTIQWYADNYVRYRLDFPAEHAPA